MNWLIDLNNLKREVPLLIKRIEELENRITELETDKPKRTLTRFAPPTEDDVRLYAFVTKKISEEQAREFASEFVNFYESKGWMVGKNKMKSWEAAVRKWKVESTKTKGITNGKFNASDAERIANDAASF